MFRRNELKSALNRGRVCSAAWVFTADVDAAEVLGTCGFDAVILDRQHTPVSFARTREQLRAVRAAGDSTVLVRVRENTAAEITVLLDMGAEGLLLPDARSVDDVRRFLSATRYPPAGDRGAHDTVSRAAGWGAETARYRDGYRSELLLIAMIESRAGAREVVRMCREPGLDMIFLGPLDLTASVGALGDWENEDYVSTLHDVEARVVEEGTLLGGALAPPGDAAAWIRRGHSFLSVGNDVSMIRESARRQLALLAAAAGDGGEGAHPPPTPLCESATRANVQPNG
ncbi:MAG: 4-hydroxy-2-oxovalerate aldolase [Microbacterium sp.]|jgi:2-keto-3-deoxy-L-rhamnonate aldolase RhmA|nr:4-hydroxy-2-oxovalerate aldolase [Microbacterium sp.]